MKLFLFWFIRAICLIGFITNLVLVDVHSIPSFLFTVCGIIAAFNVYGMGLLSHETYKSLPSLFILFRVIQLLIFLGAKTIDWWYLVIYVSVDVFVFVMFIVDNRYEFILKEVGENLTKTTVQRDDIAQVKVEVLGRDAAKKKKSPKRTVAKKKR